MWTAFGIMIGNVCDLAFYHVADRPHIKGLNWRLMLASVRFLILRFDYVDLSCITGWYSRSYHHVTGLLLPRVTTLVNVEGTLQ